MRQYAAEDVLISWTGLDLREGLVPGSFLVFRRSSPNYTYRQNGMGGRIRIRNTDKSGELDLQILNGSKTHQRLCQLALADYLTAAITGPMVIQDLSTKERWVLRGAGLVTEPDDQRAIVQVPIVWTWNFTSIQHQPNASNQNVVGS